jgi:hypothetical protein
MANDAQRSENGHKNSILNQKAVANARDSSDVKLTAFLEIELVVGGILATTVPERMRQASATEQFMDLFQKSCEKY